MGGTVAGGKQAAKTNKEYYGKDFYKRIGSKGGSNATSPKGFAVNRELARTAGRIGGTISRRGPAEPKEPVFKKNWRERLKGRFYGYHNSN